MVESPFSHDKLLLLKEQGIHQWIDSQIQNCGDRITGWRKEIQGATREKKGKVYLHFSTQSGYHFCLADAGNILVLTQDRQTRERIKEENKEKRVLYLCPDASSPYKIPLDLDPRNPRGLDFFLDGQFVLLKGGKRVVEGKKRQVVSVVDVLRDGWYQKAIFSPSHTTTAAQPEKFEKYQKVPGEDPVEELLRRVLLDPDGGLFLSSISLENFDRLFLAVVSDQGSEKAISQYFLNRQLRGNLIHQDSNLIAGFRSETNLSPQDKSDLDYLQNLKRTYKRCLLGKITGVKVSNPITDDQISQIVDSSAVRVAVKGSFSKKQAIDLLRESKQDLDLDLVGRAILKTGAKDFRLYYESREEIIDREKEIFYPTLLTYHTMRLGVTCRLITNKMISLGLTVNDVDRKKEEIGKRLAEEEAKAAADQLERIKAIEVEAERGDRSGSLGERWLIQTIFLREEKGDFLPLSGFPPFSKVLGHAIDVYNEKIAEILAKGYKFAGEPFNLPEGFVVERDPRILSPRAEDQK